MVDHQAAMEAAAAAVDGKAAEEEVAGKAAEEEAVAGKAAAVVDMVQVHNHKLSK